MRSEIRDKLNNWAFQTKQLADELRNDPGVDAQFVQRHLMAAYGGVGMAISNQWGAHLNPVAMPIPEEAPAEAEAEPVPVKKGKK